jgi:hypothetical protein
VGGHANIAARLLPQSWHARAQITAEALTRVLTDAHRVVFPLIVRLYTDRIAWRRPST